MKDSLDFAGVLLGSNIPKEVMMVISGNIDFTFTNYAYFFFIALVIALLGMYYPRKLPTVLVTVSLANQYIHF